MGLGAKCDIIDTADGIGQYTHVFFDAIYLNNIVEKTSFSAKLFSFSHKNPVKMPSK